MARCLSVVLISFLIMLVKGKPSKEDGQGKGKGKSTPRDVADWKVYDDKVKFKATQTTEEYSDKIDFEIKVGTGDGIETKFKYKVTPKGSGEHGKFEMKMKLFKIIEFKDAPGSAEGYDSADEVLQEYVLGSPKGGKGGKKQGELWESIKEETDKELDVKTFKAQTEDGVFEVIGRYSGKPVNFTKRFIHDGNVSSEVTYDYSLNPASIKFDYIIRDFPFMNNESMLALDGRFKSGAKVKKHRSYKDALESPADDGDGTVRAMFTWASTVGIDGQETPVVFSMGETTAADEDEEVSHKEYNEKSMKSLWTFPRAGQPSLYIWDPSLGCEFGEDVLISGASALSSSLLTLLSFLALRINF